MTAQIFLDDLNVGRDVAQRCPQVVRDRIGELFQLGTGLGELQLQSRNLLLRNVRSVRYRIVHGVIPGWSGMSSTSGLALFWQAGSSLSG